jgi:hypothetical protein
MGFVQVGLVTEAVRAGAESLHLISMFTDRAG